MDEGRGLILTADDFGMSAEVNAAVAELAAAGRIGATSLLVRAPHAQAALDLGVGIAVGLHVQLERDELAATSSQVETLIEDQVSWMVTRDATPAHLDLHTGALYGLGPDAPRPGGVLAEALAVAARHDLPLRLPRRPPAPMPPALQRAHAFLVAQADAAGVRLPETILTDTRPAAQVSGPPDSLAHYLDLLSQVHTGCSEMFTHPALPLASGTGDAMSRKRAAEYQMLRSGQLHAAAAAAGIAIAGAHAPGTG